MQAERLRRDDGFTLIELLVVVIVIGILAAVAIPVYIGAQTNAKNATAQSDLGNAKTAIIAYHAQHDAWPSSSQLTATTLGMYGFTKSTPNTASIDYQGGAPAASSGDFCLTATGTTGTQYYVSATGGVSTTSC